MNKYITYIVGGLLTIALVFLFITGNKNNTRQKNFNERITLRRQDKIPYGTYAAYQDLKYIFPKATIYVNKYEPDSWDSLSVYKSHQALIAVCTSFRPDEWEIKRMIRFVENGNDVFISTRYISAIADRILQCNSSAYDLSIIPVDLLDDSMKISLSHPPYPGRNVYSYPGKTFSTYFTGIDTATTDVLGYDASGNANFIRLRAGKGNFYVHTEPLAFSNYFILHKENKDYYEKVLSVIDPEVTRVAWDEYFLNKREDFADPSRKKKGWFGTLMGIKNDNNQKPFVPAFWLLIFLLLLYVLLGMRRKQRAIPVIAKPRNDSLDFIKTIGRLYYDRGDHRNLCRKMAAYFLEHVRNKYKLPTGTLDDHFINQLRFKTGVEEYEIRGIVSFIKYLDDEPVIGSSALKDFHKQLESFYKKA